VLLEREMPKGGRRMGKLGAAYPRRTDLNQAVRVPTGGPYGQAQALESQQQQQPLPGAPNLDLSALTQTQPDILPPVSLTEPSQRPDEHIMTGAPMGSGAGAEILPFSIDDDTQTFLEAMFAAFPNSDVADMLEEFKLNRQYRHGT
jgi:hypothetical protein